MKHKLKLAALFFAFSALVSMQTLHSQDTRKITLKEAIDLAVTNSHLLKNNKAKIDEAIAAVKEANDRKLPDFSISGSYMYFPGTPNIDLVRDTSTKSSSFPQVKQAVFGIASVSLPVYTGGKLKYGIESAK